jgi:hypothetical protein
MARVWSTCSEIGHGGKVILPGPDGSFDVPPELVPILLGHGFFATPPAQVDPVLPPPEPAAVETSNPPAAASRPGEQSTPQSEQPKRRRRG